MAIVNVQRIENIKDMETVVKGAMNAATLSASMMQNAAVWAIRQTFHGNVTPVRKVITAMNDHKMYRKYVQTMVDFIIDYGNVKVNEETQNLEYDNLGKVEPNKAAGKTWRQWNAHVAKSVIQQPLMISEEVANLLKKIAAKQKMNAKDRTVNLTPDYSDKVFNALNAVLEACK